MITANVIKLVFLTFLVTVNVSSVLHCDPDPVFKTLKAEKGLTLFGIPVLAFFRSLNFVTFPKIYAGKV